MHTYMACILYFGPPPPQQQVAALIREVHTRPGVVSNAIFPAEMNILRFRSNRRGEVTLLLLNYLLQTSKNHQKPRELQPHVPSQS